MEVELDTDTLWIRDKYRFRDKDRDRKRDLETCGDREGAWNGHTDLDRLRIRDR